MSHSIFIGEFENLNEKISWPLGSGLLSGSLNINKADTELQKKRSKIVAKNVEKSLMILFLKDYGWMQLTVCHFEFSFSFVLTYLTVFKRS